MNRRLRQFVACFDAFRVDSFLVTKDVNIAYLTGIPPSEGWLFLTRRQAFYVTDPRYSAEVSKEVRGVTVRTYRRKESLFTAIGGLAASLKAKKIGFDPRHLSHASYEKLVVHCRRPATFLTVEDSVERLRIVKTAEETRLIRQAVALNLRAFGYLKRVIVPGLSEKTALSRLQGHVIRQGVGFSFPPIAASGPNSSFPHARGTTRRIRGRDVVLVDMGIDVQGYKSDLTRMFFLGKIPPLIRETAEAVREAQQLAIRKIKPGIRACDVDREARNSLIKRGLGKFFSHSLGHGVGLEIHEAPWISPQSTTILKPGMIFTIEPAVYIPDQFGIRLEDMVLVTEKGCEIISA